ncbi:MAG: D-tyrosyl-tRNA(Tyr) deacylase [Planctomycetaceae bacterium]|jgi:D-tyrosyl-tRNA(Tyr) deacylase|nr:D-tyrosyl-tRNA(Tyr) deacylase [Planctomycetaceae bacterium]
MRACIQRVRSAAVKLPLENNRLAGEIGSGLLVLLGVGVSDTEHEAELLAKKCSELRIFEDGHGKMNLSLNDTGGAILVVSQFTLYADCSRGRRPGFTDAARPERAETLYRYFIDEVRRRNIPTAAGVFQTEMHIELVNDGPVTIWMDTEVWKS